MLKKNEWGRLLGPLTSEELLLVHGDWGTPFRGVPTHDALLRSLLAAAAVDAAEDINDDDSFQRQRQQEDRISRVALRAARRLSLRQTWRAFALGAAPADGALSDASAAETRLCGALSDLFASEGDDAAAPFHAAALVDADAAERKLLWMRVALRNDGGDGAWTAALLCARVGAAALLVAAGAPMPQLNAVLDCACAALCVPRGVRDTATMGSDVDSLLAAFPPPAAAAAAVARKEGSASDGDDDDAEESSLPAAKRRRADAEAWWQRPIPRKVRMVVVRCTSASASAAVPGTSSKKKKMKGDSSVEARVIVRGVGLRDGLGQLAAAGVLCAPDQSVHQRVATSTLR